MMKEEQKGREYAANLLQNVNLDLGDLDDALNSFEDKLNHLENRLNSLEDKVSEIEKTVKRD